MYEDKNEICIDGLTFDIKHNVKSIYIDITNSTKTYDFYDISLNSDPSIFFIFETQLHLAFAHWVFESAIFLPYFKHFPNARIIVNANPIRDYKQLFFKLFNIDQTKICYLDNSDNEQLNRNIPINNICICCKNYTLNDRSTNSTDLQILNLHKNLMKHFRNEIWNNYSFDYTDKSIDHLFLPRNTIQNYASNDRIINYTSINNMLSNKKFTTYYTSDTTDFNQQIKLLSNAKNIYLDFGSNLFVNGFFSKGSNIYVVNIFHNQLGYPFNMNILNTIAESNTIHYI